MNQNIVGVTLKPSAPELKDKFLEIKSLFEKSGWEVLVDKPSGEMIGVLGVDRFEMYRKSKILISLGGDGTILGLSRRSFKFQKPILGIHLGHLGFLAEIGWEDRERMVKKIVENDFEVKNRMVLEALVEDKKTSKKIYAVNELVIKSKSVGFVHVKMNVDGKYVNSYHGDGLIVSTPTGSTAYNLSSGGPIVFPFGESFIFTPIASHSLTQRPLVLPVDTNNIELELSEDDGSTIIVADGQDEIPVSQETTIKITKSELGVPVVVNKDNDFFKVLREKLKWGDHR